MPSLLFIVGSLLGFWRTKGAPDFDAVVKEFGPSLRRLVSAYAPPGEGREDLMQEILLALWQAIPRFRGQSSLRTFVFRVAHNRCIDVMRRGKLAMMEPLEEMQVQGNDESPEEFAQTNQDLEQIAQILRTLPPGQRQAFVLALEGLTHEEISHTMGISVPAVATRIHRARVAIKHAYRGV